jgi:hypothetical protein
MALKNYSNQVNPNPAAFAPSVGGVTATQVQVDFPARIDEALTDLKNAANEYESDGGKTAQAVVDATLQYNQLLAAANTAKKRMEDLVARGSALDVYNASVSKSESALQKIVELLTKKTSDEILISWYGHLVSLAAISKDRRQDLRICKKIVDLNKFQVVSSFKVNSTEAEVAKRADAIGGKLLELRDHVQNDTKKGK